MASFNPPPLPPGYSPVKTDGNPPPLPAGFTPVGEKKNSQPDLPNGVNSSSIGYDNSQSSLPLIEPKQQVAPPQPIDKAIKAYRDSLSPDELKALDRLSGLGTIRQQQDGLRVPSADEIKDQHAFDTPLGTLAKSAQYLGNKVTKGGLQLIKGGAWAAKMAMGGALVNTSDTDKQEDNIWNKADKFVDQSTGITPNDVQHIENTRSLGMGALRTGGMLAEIAPTAMLGGATSAPKAMFALQGFGQGKETMDAVDPDKKLNPYVRNGYIALTGAFNAALMGDAAETNFAKMPAQLRGKISSALAMDAIKQNGEKEITGELIDHTVKDFADNFYRLGTDYVNKVAKTGVDLSALQGAQGLAKYGVNLASGKQVFNNPAGEAAEGISNVMLNQAPLFGVAGTIGDVSKLTPYTGFKNEVFEDIIKDPSQTDAIKEQLTQHGQERGWTQGEIDATNNHLDRIADATKKLPSTIKPEKKADAVQLVLDRDDLKKQLNNEVAKRTGMDESVNNLPTQHELWLTDKIDQANDKLRAMATGKKTTYSKGTVEDEGKFFKTTDGTKEEITEPRYELEKLEREAQNEKNVNENSNEQVREQPIREEVGQNGGEEVNGQSSTQENEQKEVGGQNAIENRVEQQNNIDQHQRTDGQQQGVEENRQHQEKPIEESQSETGGSNSNEESGKVTSIKNAKIDEDRAKRGLSPLMSETRKDFPTVWDNAMKKLDENPNAGRDLVDELHKKPRATTDEENALIAHTLVEAKNDYDKVSEQITKAQDKGEDITTLEGQLDAVSDRLQKIEEVARKTGTETGRGLNSRKMMVRDDMSLASLETQKRVALGRPLTADERADLKKVHEEFLAKEKEYEAKIAELEKKHQDLLDRQAVKKLQSEIKSEQRNRVKTDVRSRIKTTSQLLSESLKKDRLKLSANNPIGLSAESIKLLTEQAKNYIELGTNELGELVDKLYNDVKEHFEDITKRDIRDAVSGYGKTAKLSQHDIDVKLRELKAQARSISALEDAKSGERPLKSGLQRDKVSDVVRNLQTKVREAMKEMGITVKTREEHLKTSLDAVKTRLKNQIKDLTHQIETGEKPPEKTQIQYDAEANALKQKRDALKAQLGELDRPEMSDAQKLKNAMAATQRSLDEYNRRIKEGDLSKRKTGTKISSPELDKLREERDKAKEEFEALKDAANPKLTPEQIALKAIKTRTNNQIAEYKRRLAENDFEPTPKKPPVEFDQEAITARGELNRVKRDFEAELEKDRLANRGVGEKILDKALKYRRAELLLNLSGAAKVGMAAAYRITATPLHEIVGSGLRQIPGLKGVAELAPREGHAFNVDAEWKALKSVWSAETLDEVKKKFKGKLDNLDTAFGDKAEHASGDKIDRLLDLVGSIHAAEKEFSRQNEFRRSVILRTKYAQEHGVDTDNPFVQLKIGKEALDDADRAIFMGKNLANTGFKMLVNYLESAKTLGNTGKITANVLKFMFPIVRVTTNYALEKAQYTPVIGATKAVMIMARGLKNMKPEEADYVMRVMKKQGISAGLTAIGYFNPQAFGGFHIPGQKRDDKDPLKANDVSIFGVKIPHFLTHTPLLSALQLGATIRRAIDSKGKTTAGDVALGTGSDVVESTPFYETPKEAIKAMESTNSFNQFAGSFLRSLVVPSVVNQVAEYTDKDSEGNTIKRSPKNIGQGIEQGIPGLRKNVPIANPHPGFNEIHLPNQSFKLNNEQLQERQKYYDDFMKSDGAKRIQATIAKTTNAEQKKKLETALKSKASKISKMKILQKYHNAQTGNYDLEKIDE